eukprot:398009-Pelagomonas_calceolata.AAC.1
MLSYIPTKELYVYDVCSKVEPFDSFLNLQSMLLIERAYLNFNAEADTRDGSLVARYGAADTNS